MKQAAHWQNGGLLIGKLLGRDGLDGDTNRPAFRRPSGTHDGDLSRHRKAVSFQADVFRTAKKPAETNAMFPSAAL